MMRPLLFLFLLTSLLTACIGELRTTTFFTEGTCEACEPLIKEAALAIKGVKTVKWDPETSQATVEFYPGATSPDQIQEAIAARGFETQFYPGNEDARLSLPACCRKRIERKLMPGGGSSHP